MPLLLLVLKEKPHYCDVHGNHRKCSSILFEEFKRKIADTLMLVYAHISPLSQVVLLTKLLIPSVESNVLKNDQVMKLRLRLRW